MVKAELTQVVVRQVCQNGHSQQGGLREARCGFDCGLHHGPSAGGVDGQKPDIELADRLYGFGDGIRDVVQFKVKEDLCMFAAYFAHQFRAVAGEKLKADFESSDTSLETIHPGQGFFGVMYVQGEDELVGGHASKFRVSSFRFRVLIAEPHMKLRCPAKINLYLHILGKRSDGFHELETVMCPVSLHDELELEEVSSGVHLQVVGADLAADTSNLAFKAAAGVLKKSGVNKGVSIRLTKRIPMGGGLAGGSSNAASVIRGVNELLGCGLSEAELHEIAAGLGSDINFFLLNGPGLCQGRGERVSPVRLRGRYRAILINPGFGVPTPWAFKAYAADPRQGKPESVSLDLEEGGSLTLRNDLEPAVFGKYLWLEEAKQWLSRQNEVSGSLMSGSGATVFALLKNPETPGQAERLEAKARLYFGGDVWMEVVELL